VKLHGTDKWREVANHVGTRTGQQCRERWQNVVSKAVNRGVSGKHALCVCACTAEQRTWGTRS